MVDKTVLKTILAEAGGDPTAMAPVAAVILNRAAKTGLTPLQVVKQRGQFEGYSNPGPVIASQLSDAGLLAKAREVFEGVQSGSIPDPTNGGTQFRSASASSGMRAPHGTVSIGGNTFARGTGSPQTAIAAINDVSPIPMPRPNVAEAYAPSSNVKAISVNPNGQPASLLDALSSKYSAVRPTTTADAGDIYNGFNLPSAPPSVPVPGLTSRSVQTVPIDPMTGNPVTPQQTQRNALQDALNSYALQQRAAQQGSIKTNGQAGQVAIPAGIVPQSAQRDLSALTIRSGQPIASGVLPKPSVAPSPSILGGLNYAQGAAHPYVPGPSGSVSSYKEPSQLQASAPLEYTTKTVMVPKQVPYINSTPPSSAIIGGLGMTGGVLPKPTYKTVMVPQTVRVPAPPAALPLGSFGTVKPASQILPGLGGLFNTTPLGHITQAISGEPVQGGLLSLLFGGGNPLSGSAPASVPSGPPVGASFLQAQGQNTAGLTAGEVANNLKAAMGSHSRGSFGV